MDLRVRKTENSIREAFLRLRAKKPLDRITVKELCEKAIINKTTFYLHYQSIYELSEVIENELIEGCFAKICDEDIGNPEKMVLEFYRAFSERSELFRILFSDNRIEYPAKKANEFMTERIFRKYPYLRENAEFNIRFTAIMYGCFFAYLENRDRDVATVIRHLSKIAKEVLNFMSNGSGEKEDRY